VLSHHIISVIYSVGIIVSGHRPYVHYKSRPLKLQRDGTIQICLLLLLYYYYAKTQKSTNVKNTHPIPIDGAEGVVF